MAVCLILGISGQDGSYLSEHLLERGHRVCGIVRRHSVAETQDWRLRHLGDRIETFYGDIQAPTAIYEVIHRLQPDCVFSLAAQSHVRVSFEMPEFTANVNAIGVLRVLEAIRHACPKARMYQASSSECFGLTVDPDGFQRETTLMNPTSPYGCAKVFGFNIVRHYRRAYGLFATNGLLFNHTSPRRGSAFVEQKIVKAAVRIARGLQSKLYLGNMDAKRDFGHSKDYTRAMVLMLEHSEADDFVVATGKTYSVRDICNYVFAKLGMNYREHVETDEKQIRPEELPYLRGDATKARTVLGWKPEYTFEQTLDEMIQYQEKVLTDGTDVFAATA